MEFWTKVSHFLAWLCIVSVGVSFTATAAGLYADAVCIVCFIVVTVSGFAAIKIAQYADRLFYQKNGE